MESALWLLSYGVRKYETDKRAMGLAEGVEPDERADGRADGRDNSKVQFSHNSDVIMIEMASPIISLTIVTQLFIQAQIKENIKAPRHWRCEGYSPVIGEFPP